MVAWYTHLYSALLKLSVIFLEKWPLENYLITIKKITSIGLRHYGSEIIFHNYSAKRNNVLSSSG